MLLVLFFVIGVHSHTFENVSLGFSFNETKVFATFDTLKEIEPQSENFRLTISGLIPVLPEGSVSDLENITYLDISRVGLETVKPGAFRNLPHLEILVLRNNNLKELQTGSFSGLSLKTLSLDGNSISDLHEGALNGVQVRHVSLADNKLARIETGVFDDSIVSLNLYGNLLEKVAPKAFPSNVSSLVLSNNKFQEINPEAFNLPELNTLDLSFNQIKSLKPGDLNNLQKLNSLELVANSLQEITEGVFNFLHLTHLKLNYNNITNIASNAFDNMTDLSVIHIDYNNLTRWDKEWLRNTPQLAYIFAGFNQIEDIPDEAFKNYPKMYSIDLQENLIKSIASKAFDKLKNVVNFSLRNNQIENWNQNLLANTSVGTIDLSGNKMRCIEGSPDKAFENVDFVHLWDNPWNEECKEKIKEFEKRKEAVPKTRSYFKD